MSEVYKSISYLFISVIISIMAGKLESNFLDEFTGSLITLLTTLLAINIASSSLIAGKLNELNIISGKSFEKTRGELKRSLIIQVVLIIVAFMTLILSESTVLRNTWPEIIHIKNSICVAIFIYYLDAIKDLGTALFMLIKSK